MKSIAFLLLAFFLVTIPPALCQDANYWLLQTHSDYNNGSNSLALQDIDEYLEMNSSDTWAWSFKANLLIKMKRYSEAVDSFDQLILLNGANAQAYNDRGLILSGGMRQHEEALNSLETALKINPNDANFWFNKGIVLENMKSYAEALDAYKQATAINPSLDRAWYRQGWLLALQGSFNESLPNLDEAIKLNPKNADAWNTKGLVLMEQNLKEEAQSCFEKAIALQPTNQDFQNNLQEAQEGTEKEPEKIITFKSQPQG
jgi:tetratricopeptide (TPR) repeat protein